MPKFEWDEQKNKINKVKHKLSFEDAREIFKDDKRIQYIRKSIINLIQEEKNLIIDFGSSSFKKLQLANVDYLFEGVFITSFRTEIITFHLSCTKVSGDNISAQTVFPILKFRDKDLENIEFFEKQLKNMLEKYSFREEFGVLETSQLEEISNKIDEKNEQIENLSS